MEIFLCNVSCNSVFKIRTILCRQTTTGSNEGNSDESRADPMSGFTSYFDAVPSLEWLLQQRDSFKSNK